MSIQLQYKTRQEVKVVVFPTLFLRRKTSLLWHHRCCGEPMTRFRTIVVETCDCGYKVRIYGSGNIWVECLLCHHREETAYQPYRVNLGW